MSTGKVTAGAFVDESSENVSVESASEFVARSSASTASVGELVVFCTQVKVFES